MGCGRNVMNIDAWNGVEAKVSFSWRHGSEFTENGTLRRLSDNSGWAVVNGEIITFKDEDVLWIIPHTAGWKENLGFSFTETFVMIHVLEGLVEAQREYDPKGAISPVVTSIAA